jgi:ADP-heptose:LPS heptosyltransferase
MSGQSFQAILGLSEIAGHHKSRRGGLIHEILAMNPAQVVLSVSVRTESRGLRTLVGPFLFSMRKGKYRYRPHHAILEWLTDLLPSTPVSEAFVPLDSTPQKLLVLKFGGMGEAVLASSLLTTLKRQHPSMQVDFLVEERVAGVVNASGEGTSYFYDPRKDGFWKAIGVLRHVRQARYDAVIDFEQQSLLTALFARITGIPSRLGFSPSTANSRARMLTHVVQLQEGEPMWRWFVRLARILDPGIPESLQTEPLPFSGPKPDWATGWLQSHGIDSSTTRLVAVHLGVGPSAQYRRWPMERFLEFARTFSGLCPGLALVLTGSREERVLIRRFIESFEGRCVDASDLGGIEHTAALVRQCDLLISADTGIMHLAAAMGTPTVGLFGPNTPDCWAPAGPRATYVYSTRMRCSPCINSYQRKIPEICTASQESACMWDISVDDVLRATASVVEPSRLGFSLPRTSNFVTLSSSKL